MAVLKPLWFMLNAPQLTPESVRQQQYNDFWAHFRQENIDVDIGIRRGFTTSVSERFEQDNME